MLHRSLGAARAAFGVYAAIEPRLNQLWELCESVQRPKFEADSDDDPFELDRVAGGEAHDGWCAEDFFLLNVKSKLLVLVGSYRTSGPKALQSTEAFECVYDLLINWTLARPCACCAPVDEDGDAWLQREETNVHQ